MCASVKDVLGDQFVGLYLYGSLATGDFDPATSDIDFLVVTIGELLGETIHALDAMHTQLLESAGPWASKLEGSYMPLAALRRFNPAAAPVPQVNERRFFLAPHGSDWVIQRYVLREFPVALAGHDLRDWIDPVQPDDLRRAVAGILCEWWAPMLDDPTRLRRDDYQAYAVLTMCRALYTLELGTFVSKPVAARWAQQTLGEPWARLIERALSWHHSSTMDVLDEILALLRYTLDRSRPFEAL